MAELPMQKMDHGLDSSCVLYHQKESPSISPFFNLFLLSFYLSHVSVKILSGNKYYGQ